MAPRTPVRLSAKPDAGLGAPLTDQEIRHLLKARLRGGARQPKDTAILEELGLRRRQVFVDLVVVNGHLHGFEIKSDRDSLRRLARQVSLYGQVMDRATLVVGSGHLDAAVKMVPSWWEILAVSGREGNGTLVKFRAGAQNRDRSARSLVELLWLEDSLRLLELRGGLRGYRGKPRRIVWDRVCELYDIDEIAAAVREQLKSRAVSGSLRLSV